MEKYLNHLLLFLVFIYSIVCYICIPFTDGAKYLEILIVVVLHYYIINFYRGSNIFVLFIKQNIYYHRILFLLYSINLLSILLLLLLYAFMDIPLECSKGFVEYCIKEYILNPVFCGNDDLPLANKAPRQANPFESVIILTNTFNTVTATVTSLGLTLNVLPLTKKLSVTAKLIPLSLTGLITGFSAFSLEYQKVCNQWPHELGTRYFFNSLNNTPEIYIFKPCVSLENINRHFTIFLKPSNNIFDPIRLIHEDNILVTNLNSNYDLPLSLDLLQYLHICYKQNDLSSINFFLEFYSGYSSSRIENIISNLIFYDCIDFKLFEFILIYY